MPAPRRILAGGFGGSHALMTQDLHGQVAARGEIVGLAGRIGAVHSEDGAVCDWHWLALVGTI